jgi:signal transduction histidine kinase
MYDGGAGDRRQLLHAIDLMTVHDWENAKSALERIDDPVAGRLHLMVGECERREREQHRSLAFLRHEVGNALAIAIANLEGVIDGVLPANVSRWQGIAEALRDVTRLLERYNLETDEPVSAPVTDEVFSICALIAAQYAAISGLANAKDVRVAYYPCGKHHASCAAFRGDAVAMGQILRNVLINAVRYTPPGGNVELVCDRPDGQLLVTIRNSGPGIAPADAAHLFEEGYRGGNATRDDGSGLGLAVVAKLLKAFHGRAQLLDEGRDGTTFSIALPATPST